MAQKTVKTAVVKKDPFDQVGFNAWFERLTTLLQERKWRNGDIYALDQKPMKAAFKKKQTPDTYVRKV